MWTPGFEVYHTQLLQTFPPSIGWPGRMVASHRCRQTRPQTHKAAKLHSESARYFLSRLSPRASRLPPPSLDFFRLHALTLAPDRVEGSALVCHQKHSVEKGKVSRVDAKRLAQIVRSPRDQPGVELPRTKILDHVTFSSLISSSYYVFPWRVPFGVLCLKPADKLPTRTKQR